MTIRIAFELPAAVHRDGQVGRAGRRQRVGVEELLEHLRGGELDGPRLDRERVLEDRHRHRVAVEGEVLLHRLDGLDARRRHEPGRRGAEPLQVASLEAGDHVDLPLAQLPDMQHLADHHVDRLIREVAVGVRVHHPDPVAHRVGQRRPGHPEHARILLHRGDVRALLRGEVGQHPGAGAEVQYVHPGADHLGDRRPERGHPVLVQQHLRLVLQRDEVGGRRGPSPVRPRLPTGHARPSLAILRV